jgi:IclR family transcriptional regulator, mhp operon transcriptional activator
MHRISQAKSAFADRLGVGAKERPISGKWDVVAPDAGRGRANSQRGASDQIKPSYPAVASVRRALEILRVLNRLRIATIGDLHAATKMPKPTIVRMLETLIAEGYVARDNMCGGYRVTHRVQELNSGYEGIAQIIEVSRPFAIELTNRIKWPVGLGTFDGDAIAIQFWTGSISPWARADTILGNRPSLVTSAMGRAYLAFCGEAERKSAMKALREDRSAPFDSEAEERFHALLAGIREKGYALRAPHTEPRRSTTVAMPIRDQETVLASVTVSFFTSAVPREKVVERIIEPLRETVGKIEDVMKFIRSPGQAGAYLERHAITI